MRLQTWTVFILASSLMACGARVAHPRSFDSKAAQPSAAAESGRVSSAQQGKAAPSAPLTSSEDDTAVSDEQALLREFDEADKQLRLHVDSAMPADEAPESSGAKPVSETQAKRSARGATRQNSTCVRACKALESMQRAATRYCGLVGEEHRQCAAVRERLDEGVRRVQASCPGCEAAQNSSE
jgi:hypothetical protein